MKSSELVGRFIEILDTLDSEGFRVPGLIMSSPGFGKTTTVEIWCEVRDYNLTTLIASQYSQDDILGIQAVVEGKLKRLTPAWFNNMVEKSRNGKRNVLFIDELTTCDEFLQAPLLNLIFSRSLGLDSLPNNTLIVTAGNYSEELNGVFSLTAPLVNRFMILNLVNDDFDMREVTSRKILDIRKNRERCREYLGLVPSPDLTYKRSRLKDFINKYVSFGKSDIINTSKMGLVGFTSIRSVYNCINFYDAWVSKYGSKDWARIVGDTLGTTERSGKTVLLRELLSKNLSFFEKEATPLQRSGIDFKFNEMIQTLVIGSSGPDLMSTIDKLKEFVKMNDLTQEEWTLFDRVKGVNGYTREFSKYLNDMLEGGNTEDCEDIEEEMQNGFSYF